MSATWRGVFPAATTQFHEDERIDLDATMRHIDVLVDSGIHGLVMLGTVGENGSLSGDEKLAVMRAAVARVGKRVPVLAGVAENTTAAACRFAREARSAGVDGLMVLPAMIYHADTRETIHHMRVICDAAELPVMVYNNPVSYGVDLKPADFESLARDPRIIAIKESSDDPRRIAELRRLYGDRFALFCGVDNLVLESFAVGATGWISGLVNAFPRENAALWRLLERGAFERARELYAWYLPLLRLDTLPKLVQYIKLAMQEVGLGRETCRAPRLRLDGTEREEVVGLIRAAIRTRPDLSAILR
ncbi:MAG: dihydrodipicolinate synthase family protein [Planctomycetes bacterium]|nr:dihydrodipicolinate synthase family protein [Planctomycetota bacterium]